MFAVPLQAALPPRILLMAAFGLASIAGVAAFALIWANLPTIERMGPVAIGTIVFCLVTASVMLRTAMSAANGLERQGQIDPLTRLPNRWALDASLARTMSRDGEVAVAVIDLDGFKVVNDLYGHAAGDRLIAETARMLQGVCQNGARAYRIGGDEFAICMEGANCNNVLEGMCRGLLTRLARPILLDNRRIAIGASIGLAWNRAPETADPSELLRRADMAMYITKRNGKMRCTWFDLAFERELAAARDLEAALQVAITGKQFRVAYQPLVDARTGKIVATEALLRWHKPDGTIVYPNDFIPAAEENGLINEIGLFVLRQACLDGLPWNNTTVSVNLSSVQLRNPEFPIKLGEILEETGFPAERLELEVTETCMVLDPEITTRALDIIRGFGIRVALDDFGTGFASIGFLRQFRFQKLKIDRSLISGATDSEGTRAMIASSVSMAQALDMQVTAEGVETQAQADLVRAAGCDELQGWLYFKAMPPAELPEHLGRVLPLHAQNGAVTLARPQEGQP